MAKQARQRRMTVRRSSKPPATEVAARRHAAVRHRVTATMKRYARLDDHDQPVRCAGFHNGSKIIFDTPQVAESCRRSLVDRGLSETRSVHECRRSEGETHYHLTRRSPVGERE